MTKKERGELLTFCHECCTPKLKNEEKQQWFEKGMAALEAEQPDKVYVLLHETSIGGIYTSKDEAVLAHKEDGDFDTVEEALADLETSDYPVLDEVDTNKEWNLDR